MARPRKTEGEVAARQRIQDTFWELLEQRQLRDITVGIICAHADCNRGTFYYHYRDLDALIDSVIEEELLGDRTIAESVFRLSAGTTLESERAVQSSKLRRMSLLLNRGGMDMVLAKVRRIVLDMWQAVLCPDGRQLSNEARYAIEFCAGGMLSMLVNVDESGIDDESFTRFVGANSRFTIERLALAQGMPVDEITARLAAVNHFLARSA